MRAWLLFLAITVLVWVLADYLQDGMITGEILVLGVSLHPPPLLTVTHGHSEVSHNKWRSKLTKRIVAKKILKSIKRQ